MSNRILAWVRYWGPAVAWAAAISVFSTSYFSGDHTSRFLIPFLQWLLPHADAATILGIHDAIRKASHFLEYFILSLLVFRGFRGPEQGWRLPWTFWTLALVVGYSALDEVHQAFVPSRTGSPIDVMIDAIGTSLAQLLLWAHFKNKPRGV